LIFFFSPPFTLLSGHCEYPFTKVEEQNVFLNKTSSSKFRIKEIHCWTPWQKNLRRAGVVGCGHSIIVSSFIYRSNFLKPPCLRSNFM
jgi:hypothetical protein